MSFLWGTLGGVVSALITTFTYLMAVLSLILLMLCLLQEWLPISQIASAPVLFSM